MLYIFSLVIIISIAVIGLLLFLHFKKNNKFEEENFHIFFLSIANLLVIFIFSVFAVIFMQQDDQIFLFNKKIYISEVGLKEFKNDKLIYLSGSTLINGVFNGEMMCSKKNLDTVELSSNSGGTLANTFTKEEFKDIYSNSFEKRIEGLQNLINIFFTFITISLGVLGFFGYKSIRDWRESANISVKELLDQGIIINNQKALNFFKEKDIEWKEYLESKKKEDKEKEDSMSTIDTRDVQNRNNEAFKLDI